MVKNAIILLFTFGISVGISYSSQDYADSDPTMDTMERSLEINRHERLLARIAENDAAMSGFTTDGCSGGLSIGWKRLAAMVPEFAVQHGELPPWQECCVIHDRQYHVGGAGALSANESFEQRKAADFALKACVFDTGIRRSNALQDTYGLTADEVSDLYEVISELMYRAVRIGGVPCTNQPWRWGYGWLQCR